MASWNVIENRKGKTLTLNCTAPHLPPDGGFNCGEIRTDTPRTMIVKWVLEQEAMRPGDVIKFNDVVLGIYWKEGQA